MRKRLFETGLQGLARVITSTYKNCEVQFKPDAIPNCARFGIGRNFRWVITLPFLDGADISEEDQRYLHGILDHEMCHKLFTDMDVMRQKQPIFKLLNVLEDGRVEKLGCNDYPGMSPNLDYSLIKCAEELPVCKDDVNELEKARYALNFYERNKWDLLKNKNFEDVKQMLDSVKDLVDEAINAPTTEVAKEVTIKILKQWCIDKIKEQEKEKQEKEKQEGEKDEGGSGKDGEKGKDNKDGDKDKDGKDDKGKNEGDKGDGGDKDKESKDDKGNSDKGKDDKGGSGKDGEKDEGKDGEKDKDGKDDKNGDGDKEEGKDNKDGDKDDKGGSGKDGEKDEGKDNKDDGDKDSKADKSMDGKPNIGNGINPEEDLENLLKKAYGKECGEEGGMNLKDLQDKVTVLVIKKYKADISQQPYRPVRVNDKVIPCNDCYRDVSKVKSPHVLKQAINRSLVIRGLNHWNRGEYQGKLDYMGLYRLGSNIGANIFKNQIKGQKLDCAVTLMVDGSGSMKNKHGFNGDKWANTVGLVLALADVLDKNVDLEILIQNAEAGNLKWFELEYYKWGSHYNRHLPCIVRVVKSFNEPISKIKRIHSFTPTKNAIENEALRVAAKRISAMPNKRKIIFSITDGYPMSSFKRDNNLAITEDLKEVITDIKKHSDIELVGLGIGPKDKTGVRKYYPDYVECENVKELTKVGLNKLIKILKRGF